MKSWLRQRHQWMVNHYASADLAEHCAKLADEMLRLVKEVAPTVFKDCGPKCVSGPCPEGAKSCGKKQEMMKFYKG